jgi:ATPase subunit of ABC transporter with duplicated ATPase domains
MCHLIIKERKKIVMLQNPSGNPGDEMKDPKHLQASSASKVLSIAGLRKRYRDIVAVDGISFDVAPNEIVGLLGNGVRHRYLSINFFIHPFYSLGYGQMTSG